MTHTMTPAEAREFGALVTALRPREDRGGRRVALIHEGGGMRAAFGAGVFAGFLDEDLHATAFDGVFGVSAGALNTMYWLSENRSGSRVYEEDIVEREHIPFFLFGSPLHLFYRLARGRPAIDLRAVAHIMEVARPLDLARVKSHPTPVWFPVMHARDLKTEFIDARTLPESMLIPMLVAASSVPALADAFEIEQSAFIDGACGAPLPIDEAIRRGFNDLVVVLNLPEHVDPTWYEPFVLTLLAARRGLSPELPRIVRQARLTRRAALHSLRHMPGDVRVTVIAPTELPGRVLEREVSVVRRSVSMGRAIGRDTVLRARALAEPR